MSSVVMRESNIYATRFYKMNLRRNHTCMSMKSLLKK